MQYKNLTQTFAQEKCSNPAIIFGLGREGLSTYQFLRTYAPESKITLVDDQPLSELSPEWQTAATQPNTQFIHSATATGTQADMPQATVYKTPGIPPEHQFLLQLKKSNYAVSSNTQLFLQLLQFYNNQLPADQSILTVGVTGTKGKSTTTSLIAAALSQSQYYPVLGGNIGRPTLDLIADLDACPAEKRPVITLELSCHQLADLSISPNIAVIQNITPEHLDYYATTWQYVAAKSGIVRSQQATDTVITATEFQFPIVLATQSQGKHISYQVTEEAVAPTNIPTELGELLPKLPTELPPTPAPRVRCEQDSILVDTQKIVSLSQLQTELHLFGDHNRYNLLAAITVATVLSVRLEQMLSGLRTFEPLAHRLQLITEKNGVRYINDSLATTPEAAAAAIASFSDSPVVLIAGGHDRHLDFTPLVDALVQYKVKGLVLFPPTGELISETLQKRHPGTALGETQYKVQSMAEAVQVANKLAKNGDVVLLSPASASFGSFRDYQDRGEQFIQAVKQLTI